MTLPLDLRATPGLQQTEFALMALSRRRTPHVPVDPALAIVARFEELGE